MWNEFAEILQDQSYKRLGFALVASIALHLFLLGKLDLTLLSLKKEMHVIEARIHMPKVVEKPVETTKPEETITPDPEPEPEPLPELPPETLSEPESGVLQEPIVENPTPVVAEAVAPPSPEMPAVSPPVNSEPESTQEEPQPVDEGLIINENAYQYVETDFDVRTKIDGSAEGKATITYNLVDKQYRLKSLMQARGLAALVISDLLQTSEGVLTKSGLQPNSYIYLYGDNTDKIRSANFDWQTKKVTLKTSKGTKIEELPEGTQDLLSFMYQFMHVAPLQTMQIPIATGKKLAIYDYSFEGEENINIKLGELNTIHIVHSGNSDEEKTELWLAIDYQYVPVKIRKIEKNGKVYELVATRIQTKITTKQP
jgi:Protein of unknown function (DUF3108)